MKCVSKSIFMVAAMLGTSFSSLSNAWAESGNPYGTGAYVYSKTAQAEASYSGADGEAQATSEVWQPITKHEYDLTGACNCNPTHCSHKDGSRRRPLKELSENFSSTLLSLRKSDPCFDDFISPMINPIFFEDPRTLTEFRPIYLRQETPNRIGDMELPGGNAQVFAAQIRIALTERLSFIATKDGYLVSDIDGPLGDILDDGWADLSGGLKYNLVRNAETGTLWSIGSVYEIPLGSRKSLQAVGDGEFNFFTTFGQRLYGGNAHWLSSVGYRLPVDSDVQTSSIHWSNQFDVRVTKSIYLLSGVAWWHWVDDAEAGLPLGIGGGDFFNLPSTNVAGRDLVTQNVGAKYKPNRNFEAGIAYEFPLTNNQDLLENRVHLDAIFRY